MSGLTRAAAMRVIDASFLTSAWVAAVSPINVKLLSVTGTAAAAGTEVVGGSYVAQQINTHMVAATNADPPVGVTNAILTYSAMPAITVPGIDITDSAGTPFRWWWGPLAASKSTNAGDTLSFAVAAISASISSP